MSAAPEVRFAQLSQLIQAALLRIGRKIGEGFEGEITLTVTRGGIRFVRWSNVETGDVIRQELS